MKGHLGPDPAETTEQVFADLALGDGIGVDASEEVVEGIDQGLGQDAEQAHPEDACEGGVGLPTAFVGEPELVDMIDYL